MMKMKKVFVFYMALTLLFALAACGNATQNGTAESESSVGEETNPHVTASEDNKESTSDEETMSEEPVIENDDNGTDILVVYFSRTGEQYGVGVIDEGNTAIVAQMIAEQTGADTFEILPVDDHYPMTYSELTDVAKQEQNENARPAYEGGVPDLSQYSTIFIGAPVWWGDRKLSSACPDSTVGDGLAIRGNDCQNKQDDVRESVKGWLSGFGY